jgi:hypothetical protein
MNMIDEIKKTLEMEIRPNSQGSEYLEAVIDTKDIELLNSLGGLRKGQSFFYRQVGHQVIYAALWPWESDPTKITLKSGVCELS